MTDLSPHPGTRTAIDAADEAVNALLAGLEPPVSLKRADRNLWVFRRETGVELALAKCARLVSGLRSAVLLADAGFLPESASILRILCDLSTEVLSVIEGVGGHGLTRAQKEFIKQFFERPIDAPEPTQTRLAYQSRSTVFKGVARLAGGAGQDAAAFARMKEQLDYSLDAYVHGSYATCMELYDAYSGRFMLNGVRSQRDRDEMHGYIASIAHQSLIAIGMTALAMNRPDVDQSISAALDRLVESREERYAT